MQGARSAAPETYHLDSFHPETVFFRPGGVNLQGCLCDILQYASAQPLGFLARTKKSSFPIWKLHSVRMEFPDEH